MISEEEDRRKEGRRRALSFFLSPSLLSSSFLSVARSLASRSGKIFALIYLSKLILLSLLKSSFSIAEASLPTPETSAQPSPSLLPRQGSLLSTMSSSTDLPFDRSKAQRTIDSDRTMFTTSPPRQSIPTFTNQPPSPPSASASYSYSSPPPSKNTHNNKDERSYSSVSSTSHENETQRLAQEQQSSYAMQDFGSSSSRLAAKQQQFLRDEDQADFRPPQPAYQQPLNAGSADGGSIRSGNESSDDGLTATDSEDEFDWDEDDALDKEKEDATGMVRGKHRAKRGRRVYLWLMSLSRWFRCVNRAREGREGQRDFARADLFFRFTFGFG